MISGDKAKTQTYCQIDKLSDQATQAAQKKDDKKVEARLGSFPRFLRLAMIGPWCAAQRYNGPTRSQLSIASYQQIIA
jgi:hypothetical protein